MHSIRMATRFLRSIIFALLLISEIAPYIAHGNQNSVLSVNIHILADMPYPVSLVERSLPSTSPSCMWGALSTYSLTEKLDHDWSPSIPIMHANSGVTALGWATSAGRIEIVMQSDTWPFGVELQSLSLCELPEYRSQPLYGHNPGETADIATDAVRRYDSAAVIEAGQYGQYIAVWSIVSPGFTLYHLDVPIGSQCAGLNVGRVVFTSSRKYVNAMLDGERILVVSIDLRERAVILNSIDVATETVGSDEVKTRLGDLVYAASSALSDDALYVAYYAIASEQVKLASIASTSGSIKTRIIARVSVSSEMTVEPPTLRIVDKDAWIAFLDPKMVDGTFSTALRVARLRLDIESDVTDCTILDIDKSDGNQSIRDIAPYFDEDSRGVCIAYVVSGATNWQIKAADIF